jgi:hypothetical protein
VFFGHFAFGIYFGLLPVGGFCLLLWAFWYRKLLKRNRITEGKRIAKGKLLKGKEWLKRG